MEEANETLYIQNLNEKIKPDGKFNSEMRILMYQLFAQYGTVLEVHTKREYRMRGQAFVVYDNKEDATNAMHQLQDYYFYGKPLVNKTQRISYSKSKSDAIARRLGLSIDRTPVDARLKKQRFFEKLKAKQARKLGQHIDAPSNGTTASNHILFIEGLTENVTKEVLDALFRQYPGFMEVRVAPERGVAFAEFSEAPLAGMALKGLNGYSVNPQYDLNISYAKR